MISGFKNEDDLLLSLNNKMFKDLDSNLKSLILFIHKTQPHSIINCFKIGGEFKTDLTVMADNKQYNLSIKKGTGNSVHQEKVDDFIEYLGKNFEPNNNVFDNIKHFIWGDGTINGKGEIANRLSASQYSKIFPEKIASIQRYFDKHKDNLIRRFVIDGVSSKHTVDFLYYGSSELGKCVSSNDLLSFLNKSNSKGAISVGKLTFQAWNRNINGGVKSEHKRGQIQLKWGSLKEDIQSFLI